MSLWFAGPAFYVLMALLLRIYLERDRVGVPSERGAMAAAWPILLPIALSLWLWEELVKRGAYGFRKKS